MKVLFTIALSTLSLNAFSQYTPQAGVSGSTAIHKSSPLFVNWATYCSLQRGWLDIAQPGLGLVSAGDSSLAIGAADNFVVSLGDSGVATLTFQHPVMNGPGADFAIFENGFPDPADPENAFLELAFVEVSSDGVNFFRFPSSSLTPTDTQIAGAGVYMDARNIDQLAGKYIGNYGTPFDLDVLSGTTGLDLNAITHIRIIDVVGSIDKHSSRDAANNIINDPYPTPFAVGGFDLDAVGVIHQNASNNVSAMAPSQFSVFPNPASDYLYIKSDRVLNYGLYSVTGTLLLQGTVNKETQLNIASLSTGIYVLRLSNPENQMQWSQRVSIQ